MRVGTSTGGGTASKINCDKAFAHPVNLARVGMSIGARAASKTNSDKASGRPKDQGRVGTPLVPQPPAESSMKKPGVALGTNQ